MVKFMLVFDTESLSVNDIHLCHLKIKNKNKAIRYSITVEGLLHQNSSMIELMI